MARHRIHVPLLDNPAILRETEGEAAGEGRFKLVGRTTGAERWKFVPGEMVECESRKLPDGSHTLVAVSATPPDFEYRARRVVYAVSGGIVGAIAGAAFALGMDTTAIEYVVFAVFGAVAFAVLSALWGDAAWRSASRWASFDWWPRGW